MSEISIQGKDFLEEAPELASEEGFFLWKCLKYSNGWLWKHIT
jgi:hypothetical protein